MNNMVSLNFVERAPDELDVDIATLLHMGKSGGVKRVRGTRVAITAIAASVIAVTAIPNLVPLGRQTPPLPYETKAAAARRNVSEAYPQASSRPNVEVAYAAASDAGTPGSPTEAAAGGGAGSDLARRASVTWTAREGALRDEAAQTAATIPRSDQIVDDTPRAPATQAPRPGRSDVVLQTIPTKPASSQSTTQDAHVAAETAPEFASIADAGHARAPRASASDTGSPVAVSERFDIKVTGMSATRKRRRSLAVDAIKALRRQ